MTLLGVPEFNIGTSSTTAPAAASGGGMDMSLDDMIKSRRKTTGTRTKPGAGARKPAPRKPTGADKAAGRQRATRTAKANARRGIAQNVKGKPSPMDIEREVYRQTRMNNNTPTNNKKKNAPSRSRQDQNAQVKARKHLQNEKQKKAQAKQQAAAAAAACPTWVTGTKRPPSKKAVNAAVAAMTNNGFKVPQGMQMVISFAPAPQQAPPTSNTNNQKKNTNKNNNPNKGKQTKSGRGGGRKK